MGEKKIVDLKIRQSKIPKLKQKKYILKINIE